MAAPQPQAGQPAPDFELPDAAGRSVKLSDFRGKKTVVLYFYPRDETPGCTAQACSFRDHYQDFTAAGAEVVGISGDTEKSHESFASHHKLPFVLLSDGGDKVRASYGIRATLGLIPGRVTFVIDREGVIRLVFNSQFRAGTHVEKALELVKSLEKSAA